ncbi:MAG: aldehyde dehydrogenase family protein [Pseudomonadota bacterium]
MKYGHKKQYIDGELVDASNHAIQDVICPATEQAVATVAWATRDDTQRALRAAQRGFALWSATSIEDRLQYIHLLRDRILDNSIYLREVIMHEMGKAFSGTEEDLKSITDSLAYYGELVHALADETIEDREGSHSHRIKRQPVGVCAAFLAYNFPLLNLGFKLGPALASGCSIIIKPSEYSPLSAYIIGELCCDIGLPKGVVNILCGDNTEVGVPLCESTAVRLITMIGSTQTAQRLIAQSSATSLKRYSLECGGNAPFIVAEDADLDLAVDVGAALKIGNAGQICVSPNRFFVHESVVDTFGARLKARFETVELGFGRNPQIEMGPLANAAALQRVAEFVEQAKAQGAQLLCGGMSPEGDGYYYLPTVLRMADASAPVLQDEIFGPVAVVVAFSTREEVLAAANDVSAGLASYVFSQDESLLQYFAERLEFGEVMLNGVKYDVYLPHGGVKNSGMGWDCSPLALDDYLGRKRVTRAVT